MSSLKAFTDAASELGREAKESVAELGRSTGGKLDDARDQTAGALHATASSVRSTGRQGSAAIGNLATGTADRLDATASYLDNHELGDLVGGLRKFGRRHLTETLVFAAAIGFVAGVALNRATHTCRKTSDAA